MTQSKIQIDEKAATSMYKHAKEAFPNECCGFLYGIEKNERIINLAIPVANSKKGDQSRRFEISPFDYIKAEQFALDTGTQLLGIYHSHPNHPAIASEHDLKVAMPFFSYVIVSVMDGIIEDIKSWKLKDDERFFEEETVLIFESIFH